MSVARSMGYLVPYPRAQVGGTGTVLPTVGAREGAVLSGGPASGFGVHLSTLGGLQRLKQTALLTFPEPVSATWLPSFKTCLLNVVTEWG